MGRESKAEEGVVRDDSRRFLIATFFQLFSVVTIQFSELVSLFGHHIFYGTSLCSVSPDNTMSKKKKS